MGWLNEGALTLSRQRPAGRARKKHGVFIGARHKTLRFPSLCNRPCADVASRAASRKAVPLKPGATVTQRAVRRRDGEAEAAAAAAAPHAQQQPPPPPREAPLRARVLPSSDAFDPVAYLTTVHKARPYRGRDHPKNHTSKILTFSQSQPPRRRTRHWRSCRRGSPTCARSRRRGAARCRRW
jgi:hypothetical protein